MDTLHPPPSALGLPPLEIDLYFLVTVCVFCRSKATTSDATAGAASGALDTFLSTSRSESVSQRRGKSDVADHGRLPTTLACSPDSRAMICATRHSHLQAHGYVAITCAFMCTYSTYTYVRDHLSESLACNDARRNAALAPTKFECECENMYLYLCAARAARGPHALK